MEDSIIGIGHDELVVIPEINEFKKFFVAGLSPALLKNPKIYTFNGDTFAQKGWILFYNYQHGGKFNSFSADTGFTDEDVLDLNKLKELGRNITPVYFGHDKESESNNPPRNIDLSSSM